MNLFMKRFLNGFISIAGTSVVITTLVVFSFRTHATENSRPFVIYDNMGTTGKPADLSEYGLKRFDILYPTMDIGDPDKVEIQAWVNGAFGKTDHGLLGLDYEQWPVDRRRYSAAEVKASIARFRLVLKHARAAQPHFKFGFYGVVPLRDYNSPVGNNNAELQNWYQANDALQPLIDDVAKSYPSLHSFLYTVQDSVDILYPSLYTFHNAPADWVKYATANIQEAKRLAKGKPVYAYIWPEYHGGGSLGGQEIDGDFWRLQLDTLKNLDIDGVVLWNGNFATWNDDAPWWQATIDFLREQNGGAANFNQRPVVNVGNNLKINDLSVELSASVTDDNLPSASLNYCWYQVGGAGRVTFSQPESLQTTVTFSQPGNYRLYFEADDSDLKGGHYLSVSVISQQAIANFSYDVGNGTVIADELNSVYGRSVNMARVDGYNGQAIALNGSSSFIELIPNGKFDPSIQEGNSEFNFFAGDFTLATWVYVNNNDDNQSSFISKGLVGACCEPNGYPGYFMGVLGNRLTFRLEDDLPGLNTREIKATGVMPRNQWVYVVAVKTNERLELYANGILVAGKDYPESSPYSVNTHYPVVFGVQKYWSTRYYLTGKMDETAIFNRALNINEILLLQENNLI